MPIRASLVYVVEFGKAGCKENWLFGGGELSLVGKAHNFLGGAVSRTLNVLLKKQPASRRGAYMTGKRMVVVVLLMVFVTCPITVQAHDETEPETPMLTVTGTGQVAIAPDTAFVSFGMETAGKSLTEAQRLNNQVMQKVTARLGELLIEKDRIQTSSFTVSPQYKPPPKRPTEAPPTAPEIIGYQVSNTVTVEVRNLEKVATVIEESLAAGANHFQGLHWALRDEQQAKLSALKQAAARAREKATALSEALRVKLVRLMSANEGGHVIRPMAKSSRSMMAMEAGGGEPPIFSGEIKVEATVTLVYEIGRE